GRWFYGDALFIIDPCIWLLCGGAAFFTFSQSRLAKVRWTVFAILATALIVLSTGTLVPMLSAVLWVLGVAVFLALRWGLRNAAPATLERAAQAGIGVAALYVVALVGSSGAARADVRATLATRGIEPEAVMVAPAPADPFGGPVVVVTRDEYLTGRFNWLLSPRFTLDGER